MNRYRECRTAEADIGMRYYLSDHDGTGGCLKSRPEDFVVREISIHPEAVNDGKFTIAEITSTNWETNRLVRMLSRGMGISRERIGFAGTKDKRAVTTQLMSFECPPESLNKISLKDIVISDVYQAKRSIQIGDLIGNSFEITVNDCNADPSSLDAIRNIILGSGGFPNYFGVQRFGTARPITHIVGENIVKGDIKKAVMVYLSHPSEFEADEVRVARKTLADDLEEAIRIMPKTMSFERIMAEHLAKRPDDHRGAIAALPSNLQMMFVHAYQSYMFNMMLSKRMELGIPINEPIEGDVVIPLDGNGTPIHERPVVATAKNMDLVSRQLSKGKAFITLPLFGSETEGTDGIMGDILDDVIKRENVTNDDFVVPGLQNCCSKGSRREIVCPIKEIDFVADDGKYTMRFSLPKGNYATCLMREFMKSDMECY